MWVELVVIVWQQLNTVLKMQLTSHTDAYKSSRIVQTCSIVLTGWRATLIDVLLASRTGVTKRTVALKRTRSVNTNSFMFTRWLIAWKCKIRKSMTKPTPIRFKAHIIILNIYIVLSFKITQSAMILYTHIMNYQCNHDSQFIFLIQNVEMVNTAFNY